MAIEKRAQSYEVITIDALNKPDWPEYNMKQIKLASIQKNKDSDLGGFNLEAEIAKYPDNLFVKVFAIKKDEVNDNGDAFSEAELIKAVPTFIGVPVFCNHQNDDIEKARGIVVHAWYNKEKGGITIISRVDRVAYPTLARGIEEGIIAGSSMGCSVDYSVCSICHNKAHTADEYCDCVKNRKNKKTSGKFKCKFHASSSSPSDDCPICGCKKGEANGFEVKEARVYEHNFGIKFIEDSFVVNPACHECLVEDIFNKVGLSKKVAELKNKVTKLSEASCSTGTCDISGKKMMKAAGKEELSDLSNVMNILEKVAKSMLAQKEYVSMDYVSDIVETLASVQAYMDELTEMGYGQLPSPQLTGQENIELPKTSEDILNQPQQAGQLTRPQALQPQQPQPSGASMEGMGDLGTITSPKLSEKKKEFIKESSNLIKKLSDLCVKLSSQEKISDNSISTPMNNKEPKMAENKTGKDSSEQVVVAAAHNTDVITEKQLPETEGASKQKESPNVIGEKQLEDVDANKDKSDFGKVLSTNSTERKGSYDTITEKQLGSVKEAVVARWNEYPEVITEKQWTDMARLIGSEVVDQSNIITEKQMADFLSHHRYVAPEVVTEKQLPGQSSDLARWASYQFDRKAIVKAAMSSVSDMIAYFHKTPSEIKKVASFIADKPKNLDKAAFMVLVNALPHKAEARKAEREQYSYFSKIAGSGVTAPSTLDALVVSVSDHLGTLSADDVLQAIKHVASSEKGMIQIEASAKEKIAAPSKIETVLDKTAEFDLAITELDRPEDGTYEIRAGLDEIGVNPTDKTAFLVATEKFATAAINDSGIKVGLTQIDIDDTNKVVVARVKDLTSMTEEEKAAYAGLGLHNRPLKSKIEDENEGGFASDLEVDALFADDEDEEPVIPEHRNIKGNPRPTLASKREDIVKTAQMLGGEMGGQGGAGQGPGAGATLPQPPAAQQPPLESFEGSALGDDLGGPGEEDDSQPKPPGSMCPVCSSSDVDIIKGEGKCNNCHSEFQFKVSIHVSKWADFLEDSKDDGKGEEESPLEGEGFELPTPGEAPAPEAGGAPSGIPAAASTSNDKVQKLAFASVTKITPESIKKIADAKIQIGSVSPITGTTQTLNLGNGEHVCLDTGIAYKVAFAVNKKNPKEIYAQWSWVPEDAQVGCDSCSRAKTSFVKAIQTEGMSEEQFDAMSMKEKGKVILAMKKAGTLKQIKTASREAGSIVAMYKQAMAPMADFPEDICRERIYRRYGKDAIALSGPYEGENLAEAIIKTLKKANVYSNNLAVKVAGIWCDKDGVDECVEDRIREGFEIKQASTVCQIMKAKYAQLDDEVAADFSSFGPETPEGPEGPEGDRPESSPFDNVDPFDDEVSENVSDVSPESITPETVTGEETVTIELPIEVAEKIEEAIEKSQGGLEVDVDLPVEENADNVVEEITENEISPEENSEVVDIEGTMGDTEISETVDPEGGEELMVDIDKEEDKDSYARGGDIAEILEKIHEISGISAPKEDVEVEIIEEHEKNETPEEEAKEEHGKTETLEEEIVEEHEKSETPEEEAKEEENKEGIKEEVKEQENKEFKEGDEEKDCASKDCMAETEEDIIRESMNMRKGHINKNNEIGMDLSGVLAVLSKKAGNVEQQNAQDTKAIGKIQGDSTIGDEAKFEADKPKAATGKATMGDESADLQKADKANIPTADARMSGEKDNADIKPELDDKATGGEQGAGSSKAASTSAKLGNLFDRMQEQMDKTAGEKTVTRKQDQDDEDIKPISGDSFIGNEKESIGEVPAADVTPAGIPRSDAFIGNEKESIGEKPNTRKMAPSIPTEDARIGGEKDNDKIAPEKTDEVTGHANTKGTLASSKKESVHKEASRIAGRMLKADIITVDQLSTKIAELSEYGLNQLHDLEKGMFSKKGLSSPSDGLEQAVIVSEASTEKEAKERHVDPKEELVNKLSGLFSLNKRIEAAQQDSDIELRKTFGR